MSNHKSVDQLPFVVCGRCKGHGTHGPGWVYTPEELDEAFGPDVDEYLDAQRQGRYDVVCEECNGARVVRGECACDACEAEARELADMYAMERAERLAGC